MKEATPRILTDDAILEITDSGIRFGDPASSEWIDFDDCRSASGRGVGERDAYADPPYIRLYTTPATVIQFHRVRFPRCLWTKDARQRFTEFHKIMEKHGAYTLDLS